MKAQPKKNQNLDQQLNQNQPDEDLANDVVADLPNNNESEDDGNYDMIVKKTNILKILTLKRMKKTTISDESVLRLGSNSKRSVYITNRFLY